MVIEKGALVAGRYRLVERIGSGAMGVVWKAQDERLGRVVAIKRLVVRYALSDELTEETRRRAMREARIAARLQHRNAIALFDVAEHEGDPILVMEFLPSKSLAAVLEERGTLTPAEVAEIGAQVADALAAAHAVGIAHRDVKPGNILLADNGTVKITDFGVSRALDDGTVTTQTGMLAGTPAYLAPEIARGDDPSRASDVFSLGSTLYHAVEGRPPFGTNTNPLALLHAVASGNVPPPRNAGPLAPTLMSLMRVDPKTRPSMSEAATTLAAPLPETAPIPAGARNGPKTGPTLPAQPPPLQAQPTRPVARTAGTATTAAMPTATPPRSTPPPTRPNRRTVMTVGAVALLVLVGTLVTVLLMNGNRDQGNRQAGQTPGGGGTSQQQTSSESPPATTTTPTPSTVAASGPIDYSDAGRFVIKYYGDIENSAGRWAMLSPGAQAVFGSEQAFQQYWAQYTDVSSSNAYGVTPNADGSVNVPVQVTYTSAGGPVTQQRVVRVSRLNGNLIIDSDAK